MVRAYLVSPYIIENLIEQEQKLFNVSSENNTEFSRKQANELARNLFYTKIYNRVIVEELCWESDEDEKLIRKVIFDGKRTAIKISVPVISI